MAAAVAEVEDALRASTLESPVSKHWAAGVPGLETNVDTLSQDELALAMMLLSEGQRHLFAAWPPSGTDDERKHDFFRQVAKLDDCYPGGLATYVQNARQLLADSRDGKNPFAGYTPSVPSGERLQFGDREFQEYEAAGVRAARDAAFVLVAGGLGERLGYSGVKLALPSQSVTGETFLQLYCSSILALQDASNALAPEEGGRRIPLVIMTSDDTHGRTQQLLESNGFFGMRQSQIKLLKQEKVACLANNEPDLALQPDDPYRIQTKPHGHGDVHALLYGSGLLNTWKEAGLKWVLFFQDTNGLLFKAIPPSLGVSATKGYEVNSLAVPRKAKEAIGGIARLKHSDGGEMVVNVEYNQLDPLLRASGHPGGDVNDPAMGFSPYPGNINQLVLALGPYAEQLSRTKGSVVEFVNPKYADATRTRFKSATRLECMMQDYPKGLPPAARVGFTVLDVWLAYSPVKNNPADAAAKLAAGTPPHSATSGELDIYRANCMILRQAGADVAGPSRARFADQDLELWPRVVWSPRWALTFADVAARVAKHAASCRVTANSTLVLDGDVSVEGLDLDGTLVVRAAPGAKVALRDLKVQNRGWPLEAVDPADASLPEEIRIRGFRVQRKEAREVDVKEAGEHIISSA